jgi:transposase
MRKLIIQQAQKIEMILQDEIRCSKVARYNHRLHGILLACDGLSSSEIANLLGDSPKTVQNWINRFQSGGMPALNESKRPGRPRKVVGKLLQEIGRDIQRNP